MEFLKKYSVYLYWLLVLVECALVFLKNFSKASIVGITSAAVLIVFFFIKTRKSKHYSKKVQMLIALISALAANILLVSDSDANNTYFTSSILSIVAMFFYSLLFWQMKTIDSKDVPLILSVVIILGGLGYAVTTFTDTTTALKLPVWYLRLHLSLFAVFTGLAVNIYTSKSKKNLAIKYYIPGIILLHIATFVFLLESMYETDFLLVPYTLSYGYAMFLITCGFTKYLKV